MTTPLNGRVTVYTNQVPFEADILRSNSYKMADVSKLAETILGSGINNATTVSGLPCLPAVVPSLQVTVGSGALYSYEFYDSTDYGVLPADTDPNHRLYKQSLNFDLVELNTPAPTVIGNTVIHLVQAAHQTVDSNIISRPYFNSADPTSPIFNSLSDTRTDEVFINIKTGVESPSPSAPAPDAGFVALYYVTVAYGQTVISGGDITVAANAPFITETLTQKVGYQSIRSGEYDVYVGSGSANSIVVTPSPSYPIPALGTQIKVLVAATNTGASVININGYGAVAIQKGDSTGLVALSGGEMPAGSVAYFVYNGSVAILLNPAVAANTLYGASYYNTANQTVLNGAQSKYLANTARYDTNGLWDNINKRYIVGKIGYFSFNAVITANTTGAETTLQIFLYKNGSALAELATNKGNSTTINGSIETYASSISDYFELYVGTVGTNTIIQADAYNVFQMKFLGK